MRPISSRSSRLWLFALPLSALLASCGPTYPKCETDEHCEDHGEYCLDGTCQQCRDNSHCAPNEQCVGGRCEIKPECTSDGDCQDNKVCRSGKCQLECTRAADCGAGFKCESNRCVDALACNSDTDCDAGLRCQSGRCTDANAGRCLDLPTVYFDFNESQLSSDAQSKLREIASCLKDGGGSVTVEGHCDERGTIEYNLALGDRRARAVMKYLENLGVPASRLDVRSKGELEPADPGHNEEAWARNRRAIFLQ